jgi:hypothetical protein
MKLFLTGCLLVAGIATSVSYFKDPFENNSHKEERVVKKMPFHQQLLEEELSDGFDFPFGDKDGKGGYTDLATGKKYSGWYIATKAAQNYYLGIHTGEDWNGNGGGDSDFGQPVYSTAGGMVLFADTCPSPWGNCILIQHVYLENGILKTVFSQYSHLKELKIEKGALELLNQPGYLYKIKSESFKKNKHLIGEEMVSYEPVEVISEEYIPNILEELKRENIEIINYDQVPASMSKRGNKLVKKYGENRFRSLE